ncbi:MAG: hypothetical protein ACE5HN_00145 [Nitrospiria bacterium]
MNRWTKVALVTALMLSVSLPLQGSEMIGRIERLGPVYPIIEPDWLTWLPKEAEKRFREKPPTLSRDQIRKAIARQMPEIDLPEVRVPRTYVIDPSMRVNHPVTDHTGKIVVPAGGRLNPLVQLPSFRPIIVINGTRERQVAWAAGLSEKPLLLITAGDLFDLSRRIGRRVYPVPRGLIERFAIERLPVILSRDGERIRVEEVVP